MNTKTPHRIEVDVHVSDNTAQGTASAVSNIKKVEAQASELDRRVNKINGGTRKVKFGLEDKASSKLDRIHSKLKTFSGQTFRATVTVIDKATAPLRAIGRLATSLGGIVLGGAGLYGGIMKPIGLADQRATSLAGFETMLKSKEKGQAFMKDVDKFAADTPFGTMEVTGMAQSLLTQGWEQEKTFDTLTKVGNLSAAMGRGSQGMQSVIRAITQIKGKGRLSAEEMMQLSEAGVPAWQYLADAKGVDISKVRKMAEDGDIGADEAIDVILNGMKQFDGMMEKMSNTTLSGVISNIKDVFEVGLIARWGKGLQTGAIKGMSQLRDWLDENEKIVGKIGDALEGVGEEISGGLTAKAEELAKKMGDITNSPEWGNAKGMRQKLDLLWDGAISPWLNDVSHKMGEGLGKATKGMILGLLGIDGGVVDDGLNVGYNFGKGFIEGFESAEVGKAIASKIGDSLTNLAPGGEQASGGDLLTLALTGLVLRKPLKSLKGAGKWVGGKLGKKAVAETAGAAVEAGAVGAAGTGATAAGASGTIGKLGGLSSRIGGLGSAAFSTTGKFAELAGKMGVVGKLAGKVGLPLVLIGQLLEILTAKKGERGKQVAGAGGGIAGILAGAGIGSLVAPGVGTIIGGIAGGLGGEVMAQWAFQDQQNKKRLEGISSVESEAFKSNRKMEGDASKTGGSIGMDWATLPEYMRKNVWQPMEADSLRTASAIQQNLRKGLSIGSATGLAARGLMPKGRSIMEIAPEKKEQKKPNTVFEMLVPNLPKFAKGGTVSGATLAWIGEGGSDETIIPHDGSDRSKRLWAETGEALGVSAGGSVSVSAPINITIQGGDVNSIAQKLQEIMPGLADQVAGVISQKLDVIYSNKPRPNRGGAY